MKLILVDVNPALCEAWARHFADLPDVSIVNGYFESIEKWDCLVSPANSFGLMDGGFDAAIIRCFGAKLQLAVQSRILQNHNGEQFVGTCEIVPTDYTERQFIAHTPTMRIPMPIVGTENVYLAMSAMLRAVERHNYGPSSRHIGIVVCPGLGTATGRVPPDVAAAQMALAYRRFLQPVDILSWKGPIGLQAEINQIKETYVN